jgi:hypothetical protein
MVSTQTRSWPLVPAIVLGALLALLAITSPVAADDRVTWTGNGVTNGQVDTVDCNLNAPDGYLHWIFTGNGATSATLYINNSLAVGVGGWQNGVMTQSGDGAFHYYSTWYDLATITAYVDYIGSVSGTPVLTISHGCPPAGEPLTISKTVVATSDFTYLWTINKDVDETSVTGDYPGDATFNYTVTVGHDAGTASNWSLSGVITVTNPNDFAVTADVTDTLDDGSLCTVTGGDDAVIPANGSSNLAYSCAVTDGSATENTASVTWAAQGILDAGSDFVVEAVIWDVDTIDECVDVTDTFDGVEVDLGDGTLCVGEDANPTVFNYSHTVPIPQYGCVEYTNTAAFVTNDTGATGSSSETVEVCSSFEGCTPGYWKVAQHLDSWVATGYSPSQTLESVFNVPDAFGLDNKTLLEALNFKGGSTVTGAAQILLRAAVAALLNESHPFINYGYDGDVVADVNAALATGDRATILALAAELDAANNAGCPLD